MEPGHPDASVPDVRLYLVRHGEAEWSLSGRHTGRTDLALTAHGESQARSLRAALQAVPFARVFASPAQRARPTCALAGLAAVAETEGPVAVGAGLLACPCDPAPGLGDLARESGQRLPAQRALHHRAKLNHAACQGRYDASMEAA